MTNLLEHFRKMQAMATAYLVPETYTDRDGKEQTTTGSKAFAFAGDMIYMLDGPEQREAEQAFGELHDRIDDLEQQRKDLTDRLAVANSDRGRATEKLGVVQKENDELRSRLMDSELAYAKMRGYLDRILDEQPTVMVPHTREPFHDRMPDGSMGTDRGGWDPYGSSRPWYVKRP